MTEKANKNGLFLNMNWFAYLNTDFTYTTFLFKKMKLHQIFCSKNELRNITKDRILQYLNFTNAIVDTVR